MPIFNFLKSDISSPSGVNTVTSGCLSGDPGIASIVGPYKSEKPEENIEVIGYKGMTYDMKGYNDFQYKVGITYKEEGQLVLCEHGFHFCRFLAQVFQYFPPSEEGKKARYFKVKAKVTKSNYDHCITLGQPYYSFTNVYSVETDKLVTNEITILEEVDEKEIYEALRGNIRDYMSLEQWIAFRKSEDGIRTWLIEYTYKEQLKNKYSDCFTTILFNKDTTSTLEVLDKKVKLAVALYEEGVSPDMRAYLLLK